MVGISLIQKCGKANGRRQHPAELGGIATLKLRSRVDIFILYRYLLPAAAHNENEDFLLQSP